MYVNLNGTGLEAVSDPKRDGLLHPQ
jgi:hypothetical protein